MRYLSIFKHHIKILSYDLLKNCLAFIKFYLQIAQTYKKSILHRQRTRRKSFSDDCNNVERNGETERSEQKREELINTTRLISTQLLQNNCLSYEQNSLPNGSITFKSSPVLIKQFHSCPFPLKEINDDNFCDLSTYL